MAAPTFVNNSSPVAVTTTVDVSWPASLVVGNVVVLFAGSSSSGIESSEAISAGFTALGVTTGGGVSVAAWWKVVDGTEETGTPITVTASGGTKGVSYMVQYAPTSGYTLAPDAATSVGVDSDTTSLSVSATGTSFTSQVDDLIVAVGLIATTVGTLTGLGSRAQHQGGNTLTIGLRLGAGTGSSTLRYTLSDAPVTSGATGAADFTGLASSSDGGNAAGSVYLIVLRQTPASTIPVTYGRHILLGR